MQFVLTSPKRYCFGGFLIEENWNWIYLAEAYGTAFEKLNVRTGEVIKLEALPILGAAVNGYQLIKF